MKKHRTTINIHQQLWDDAQKMKAEDQFTDFTVWLEHLIREERKRKWGNTASSVPARNTAESGGLAGTDTGFAADRGGIIPPVAKPITYRKGKAKP